MVWSSRAWFRFRVIVILGGGGWGPAAAQDASPGSGGQAGESYPSLRIQGRIQVQAYYFGNEDYAASTGSQSNMFVRRARVQAYVQITETISAMIVPSFEEGSTRLRLRDAYIGVGLQRGKPSTRFTLRLGQERRPFNRYVLTSSTNLPSLERGADPGLIEVSSNDLFADNGFLSHDVGASFTVWHALGVGEGRVLTLQAGLYTGEGESRNDVNNAKSFGARATVGVTSKLDVGASFFSHEGIVTPPAATTPDSSYRNNAFGVDAQWGAPGDEGLYLVGDFMRGESAADNSVIIQGVSLVGAWHIRIKSPRPFLYGVEPAVRFDWQDPNSDTDDDGSTLISGGINIYLSPQAQFRAMYEVQYVPASGTASISGVRTAFTVNF